MKGTRKSLGLRSRNGIILCKSCVSGFEKGLEVKVKQGCGSGGF